ncbi:hypothetical protein [Enorma burkinafasonensis]|uniref:hypothetical protein n=1 Tax=Enorma burkinafasonensis TaxID=2590867 RepID=UPI0026EAD9B4|nr:hypothetical protein [Enorma burkinafasonensis]MCI7730990.1 hypothetical protein [Enorma burkinafasonensis]
MSDRRSDEERLFDAMPRFSAARRARVVVATVALGCALGAAQPMIGYAEGTAAPAQTTQQSASAGSAEGSTAERAAGQAANPAAGQAAADQTATGGSATSLRDQVAPDSGASGSTQAAPRIADRIWFNTPASNFTVPYGVDVPAWLNAHDGIFLHDLSPISTVEVAWRYFGGRGPFVYAAGVSAYPDGGNLSDVLAWAQVSDPDAVSLPGMSGLAGIDHVAVMQRVDEAADIALAPEDVLDDLAIEQADGARHGLATTGSWRAGDLAVWLGAADAGAGLVSVPEGDSALALSDTYALNLDATFSSAEAGARVALDETGPYYVKAPRDMTVPGTDTDLAAGQVLRLEVRRDEAAPRLGTVELLDADGQALDAASSWIAGGMLTVGADGLTVRIAIDDAAPEGTGESSGVAAEDVELTLVCADGSTVTLPAVSFEDGVAEFCISAATAGTVTFDLASSHVAVVDAAGNTAKAELADSAWATANGVTWVRLVDDAAQAPVLTLNAAGDADDEADPNGMLVSNADEVTLAGTLNDPFFSELVADATWLAKNPFAVTVDGETTAIDPTRLSASGADDERAFDLPALAAEGRHEVDVSYEGVSAVHAGLGDFSATASAEVLIDRTDPVADGFEVIGGIDEDSVAAMPQQGNVLMDDGLTLELHVADEPAAGADEASGVETVDVEMSRSDSMDDQGTELPSQTLVPDADGTVRIDFAEEGYYDFDDIAITIEDRAGNDAHTTLAAVIDSVAGAEGLDGVVIAEPQAVGVDLAVAFDGDEQGGEFVPAESVVTLAVHDPWFAVRAHTPGFANGFTAALTTAAGEEDLSTLFDADGFTWDAAQNAWVFEIPLERVGGALADGTYELSYRLLNARDHIEFGVDTTAPVLSDAEIEDVDAEDIAQMPDGGPRVLVGTSRTLRVRVQDLLPRAEGAESSDARGDEDGTSGTDRDALRVTMVRSDDAAGDHELPAEERALEVGGDGWAEITLDAEGLYNLSDISFHLVDCYGNESTVTLADYVAALPEDERAAWAFDALLVDDPSTAPALEMSVTDVEGNPTSADPYYHRGDVTVALTIDDPWFAIYRALDGDSALVTGTLRLPGEDEPSDLRLQLTAMDFSPVDDTDPAGLWAATYALPRSATDAPLPAEGAYVVTARYGGIAGALGIGEAAQQERSFAIDYTAPVLGSLVFSETEPYPVNEDDEPWGWVFAESEQVTLDVTDNLAGIAGDASVLAVAGNAAPELAFRGSEDGLAGQMTFALEGDGTRLELAGTSITVADRAGNTASTGDFSAYAVSNLPTGAAGIAIDMEEPQISFSFDNDDVRNGRYYNAARTATVTVQDASFDLIQRFDPERPVATVARDGGDPRVALAARDFERVELGDGAVVYRAQVAFEEDADWVLSAQLTDPLGHASPVVSESFTIDTEAPVLMVDFDNDDVANGMYYNAPRTATITVTDRNFAPELGSIDARNLSGGAAPGVSGFAEVEPRREWRASASFTGEQHYRLQVAATDLAGNVAEPFDSEEFVIDMTAPSVSISGVEGGHAYAGAVAPQVSFSDVNLDTMGSAATLEGVRSGFAYTPDLSETMSETDKTTSFGNIPYEVDCDDVYTVTGEAIDLAGNTATVGMRFSVNRFGSTYYFAPGSEGIAGSYLNEARDVRVVEVNVSGIDTGSTRVELAHDDRVETLVAGEDFELSSNVPDNGWSATTYTLPATLFDEDGYYRILLSSTDAAGNLAQNTMQGKSADRAGSFPIDFAVDGAAPAADLVGLSNAGVYLDPAKTVAVDAADNLQIAQARLTIDGREAATWDATAFDAGALPEVELTVDGQPHTYVLEVRDRAGNVSSATYADVVVTGDLITFVLNTPRLLMGSVGGMVVLLGIIGAAAYLGWRHRRRTRSRRNPFGHGPQEAA